MDANTLWVNMGNHFHWEELLNAVLAGWFSHKGTDPLVYSWLRSGELVPSFHAVYRSDVGSGGCGTDLGQDKLAMEQLLQIHSLMCGREITLNMERLKGSVGKI